MLYHHVVIIFSIKMSGKSPKTEPTCSCVSAAASAESCGSLVIIATCSPKIPSPVRMDQHPPETMVDVGDWGGVLTKLRDGITWHHLHWAISSYPSAQPSPMVPLGHSCLLQQLAGDLPHLNISVNVSESVGTLLANLITKTISPLPTGLNNHSIKMYQRGTNALFRRLRFKIMKTSSGRSDVKYT